MERSRRIDGPAGAPLVVVHADLSCPDCALALVKLDRARVRIDLRHFVLRSRGVPPRRAALAVEAADAQGAFWPLARTLLEDQGRQEWPDIWAFVTALGLDLDRFELDRRAELGSDRIALETREALTGGATGVPGVFADHTAAEYLLANGYDGEVRNRSKK